MLYFVLAKVYIMKKPATKRIGRPTQRRQSSMSARMPMTPITVYLISFIRTARRILRMAFAFSAK